MPRYGTRLYGDLTFVYGAGGIATLSVSPFTATAIDYSTVSVSWLNPTGAYSAMRLVRNQDGIPDTAEDGVILIEDQFAQTARNTRTWEDSPNNSLNRSTYVPLVAGKPAYYSVWVFLTADQTWFQAGTTYTIVASRQGTQLATQDGSTTYLGRTRSTHEKLMDLLPRVFTSDSGNAIDEVDYTSFLSNFLEGFSYTLDELTTFIDLIKPVHEATNLTPERLSLALQSLDLPIENRDSTRFQRQLVREANYIYGAKGTRLGIGDFVESMTGYNTAVTPSPNLFLSNQDSTFRDWQSYQNWLDANTSPITSATGDGTTVTYNAVNEFRVGQQVTITGLTPSGLNVSDSVIVAATPAHFTLAVSGETGSWTTSGTARGKSDANYSFWRPIGGCSMSAVQTVVPPTDEVNSIDGQYVAEVTVTSTSSKLSYGNDAPVTQTIPVTAGTDYTLSFYIKSAATANVTATIRWYDYFGDELTPSTGSAIAVSSSWARTTTQITAPDDAYYAGIELSFSATGVFYLDLFQLSKAFAVTAASAALGIVTYVCDNTFAPGDIVTITGASSLSLSNVRVETATESGFTVRNAATGTASAGIADYAYDEARGVTIRLDPNKENYLLNPSFEGANSTAVFSNWVTTNSPTKTRVVIDGAHPGPLAIDAGLTYGTLESASGTTTLSSAVADIFGFETANFYTFSIYAKGPDLADGEVFPVVLGMASTSAGTVTDAQVAVVTVDGVPQTRVYYTTTQSSTVGDFVTISGSSNTDYNLSGTVVEVTGTGFALVPLVAPTGSFTGTAVVTYSTSTSKTYTNTGTVTSGADDLTTNTYFTTHPVSPGQTVTVTGMTPASYNVVDAKVLTSTATSFTVSSVKPSGWVASAGTAGTVTVLEQQMLTNVWQRFDITSYLPSNFTAALITPSVSFDGALVLAVDNAQLEKKFLATDYFDGSYTDAKWRIDGADNASDSYLYQNKFYKLPQLADNIEPFLPANTAYRVELVSGTAELINSEPVVGFTS